MTEDPNGVVNSKREDTMNSDPDSQVSHESSGHEDDLPGMKRLRKTLSFLKELQNLVNVEGSLDNIQKACELITEIVDLVDRDLIKQQLISIKEALETCLKKQSLDEKIIQKARGEIDEMYQTFDIFIQFIDNL